MSKFVVGKLYSNGYGAYECLYTDEEGVLLRSQRSGIRISGWYLYSAVEGMKLYEPPIIHKRTVYVWETQLGVINFTLSKPPSSSRILEKISIQYEEKKRNG